MAASDPDNETRTPIHHFIVVMKQNHTFDNFFGMYPGADGIPPSTCVPLDIPHELKTCVKPFHIGNYPVTNLGHTLNVFTMDYNGGQMNGFVTESE